MPEPTESSTTINPGAGGDAVRDFSFIKSDGTTVKVQAVAVVDPGNLNNTQAVNSLSETLVMDSTAILLLERISHRLDEIYELLGEMVR